MLQTTNYKLSQWEPEDRILRADFNGDNAKLDGALKVNADAIAAEQRARQAETAALANRLELRTVYSQTLSAPAASNVLRVPTAGIDWGAWKYLHVFLDPVLPGGATYSAYLNHDANYTLADRIAVPTYLLLLPLRSGSRFAHGVCWGRGGAVLSYPDLPWQSITSITLSVEGANQVLQAGTKVTILGEPG